MSRFSRCELAPIDQRPGLPIPATAGGQSPVFAPRPADGRRRGGISDRPGLGYGRSRRKDRVSHSVNPRIHFDSASAIDAAPCRYANEPRPADGSVATQNCHLPATAIALPLDRLDTEECSQPNNRLVMCI